MYIYIYINIPFFYLFIHIIHILGISVWRWGCVPVGSAAMNIQPRANGFRQECEVSRRNLPSESGLNTTAFPRNAGALRRRAMIDFFGTFVHICKIKSTEFPLTRRFGIERDQICSAFFFPCPRCLHSLDAAMLWPASRDLSRRGRFGHLAPFFDYLTDQLYHSHYQRQQ